MHGLQRLWLVEKTKTNNAVSVVRVPIFFLLLHICRENRDKWFPVAVFKPVIRDAIIKKTSLCFFFFFLSNIVYRITEDSCMIQIQTAERCVKHWGGDCSWDQPSFTKYENAPEYTSLRCKHCRSYEKNPVSKLQTGCCLTAVATKYYYIYM